MKILFITSTRIGDAVLSTGLVKHCVDKYVDCSITVACGPLVADLFRAIPNVEKVHVLVKKPHHGHWLDLWKKVWRTRWDMVIDIRNSIVSRTIWANKRYIMGHHINHDLHKVQQMASVMRLDYTPDPHIWLTDAVKAEAEKLLPKDKFILALAPAANWHGKTWPADRFIELTRRLTAPGNVFDDAKIAVLAAPNERDQVQPVLNAFAGNVVDLVGVGTPLLAAALLARTDFFIGNDSGLMHTAAAIGMPCVGLFGPSWPHIYGPWGDNASYVRTPKNFAELIDYPGYTSESAPCLMEGLDVDTVYDHVIARVAEQSRLAAAE